MDGDQSRRNLNVLSVTFMVYEIGGAHFNKDGTLFGGSVAFTDTDILIYAAIAIYAYTFFVYKSWTTFSLEGIGKAMKSEITQERNRLVQRKVFIGGDQNEPINRRLLWIMAVINAMPRSTNFTSIIIPRVLVVLTFAVSLYYEAWL